MLDVATKVETIYLNVEASIAVDIINPLDQYPKNYPKVLTILYNTI